MTDADFDSVVHLRVPRALKNAWVKRSQAASMKLSDWLVLQVESAPGHAVASPPSLSVRPLLSSPTIAELRANSGLSQAALGAALGVSKSTIEKWEAGAVSPPQSAVELLMLLSGQHPTYVLQDRAQ